MTNLKFAIIGAGFWSRYQLAGWRELREAECVAIYNRTRSKAERLAAEFGVPAVYDDPAELLDREQLDFVDIITDVDTHRQFVELAVAQGVPAICQKPMAPSLEDAVQMAASARRASVPLFIHENWRWQAPLRALKRQLTEQPLGEVFRARVTFTSAFAVFENQPFLKELDHFILTDIGSHLLDTVRFLFGEVRRAACETCRTRDDIRGENVATALLAMESGASVVCEMAYAGRTRHECFPQTRVLVEGVRGSLELDQDYWIHAIVDGRHATQRFPPARYGWADPAYDVVHASIVDCNRNLLGALRGEGPAETTAEDNLRTVRLVFACYESAARGEVIRLG